MEKTGGRARFGESYNFFDKRNKYENESNGLQVENLCSMTSMCQTDLMMRRFAAPLRMARNKCAAGAERKPQRQSDGELRTIG